MYPDADGDGFGAGTGVQRCTGAGGAAPPGYSLSNTDCCATDANAYPGQTRFFSATNACGSYDYNCNGTADREFPAGFTGCTYTTLCGTGRGYPCMNMTTTTGFAPGWGTMSAARAYVAATTIPACGGTGTLVTACGSPSGVFDCGSQVYCEYTVTTGRAQGCR